jgi:fructokinase
MKVMSIGEILWDVFPDQELLGGAPLNFSVNIARLGDSATLISAVGNDSRGRAACSAMKSFGLTTEFVRIVDDLPTGVAIVGTNSDGEPHFEIPRPAAFDAVGTSMQMLNDAVLLQPDWLYFGTLLQIEPNIEHATQRLIQGVPSMRRFYDLNLRREQWSLPLVQRLCRLASILKLNEAEAKTLSQLTGVASDSFSLQTFCELWAAEYKLEAICITLGSAGCCVYHQGSAVIVPGYSVVVQDTVGAGDAFAAAFLHGYHLNWPVAKTARFANALGSIVASRAGAIPPWSIEECFARAEQIPS